MSKLFVPRKLKKACKTYRSGIPLKTKWLRYVYERYAIDWYYEEHEDVFENNIYEL